MPHCARCNHDGPTSLCSFGEEDEDLCTSCIADTYCDEHECLRAVCGHSVSTETAFEAA